MLKNILHDVSKKIFSFCLKLKAQSIILPAKIPKFKKIQANLNYRLNQKKKNLINLL